MVLRPHCSQAETMISCQRARRLSARSPASFTMLRSVISGWNTLTPISTPFCSVNSMRSPLEIACASPSHSGDSRLLSSKRLMSQSASRLAMAVSVAWYSPPRPSNRVMASPSFSRNTCTWRTTWSGRDSERRPARGVATKNLGMVC